MKQSTANSTRHGNGWGRSRRLANQQQQHQQQRHTQPRRRLPQQLIVPKAAAVAGSSWPEDGGSDQLQPPHAQGASLAPTVASLTNVIMGAGYVSIPFAFSMGGWAALPVLLLLGSAFCYTGLALLQCCSLVDQQQADRPPHDQQAWPVAGYEAVAGAAFGRLGLSVVAGVMYAELLGICCVYVVLEADILCSLLSHTQLGAALQSQFGVGCWGLLASALLAPTVLLPDLKALAALGALGVAAAATVGLALAALFCLGPAAGGPAGGPAVTLLLQPSSLPGVLGILAFVYAGHSTFPVIQRSMARPEQGPRAVMLGYAATALICSVIGASGYALYGPSTAPVITSCLPAGTLVAIACTALTGANPLSAFALTLEPVALALQSVWRQPDARQTGRSKQDPDSDAAADEAAPPAVPYPLRAAVRLGLALCCCLVANVLPFVAELMAFVGALLTMSISLIIPALMHVRLLWGWQSAWGVALDASVLLLGVICAGIGASSALGSLQLKMAAGAG